MSANKYKPHVVIIPEDKANNDLVNGFLLHHAIDLRQVQPVDFPGGWPKVAQTFSTDYASEMQANAHRHVVLVVDFDEQSDRLETMIRDIPEAISDRVFVIGVWSEPEDLPRASLGSKEEVGLKLATECYDQTNTTWNHNLLKHNLAELQRMNQFLRPILFPVT